MQRGQNRDRARPGQAGTAEHPTGVICIKAQAGIYVPDAQIARCPIHLVPIRWQSYQCEIFICFMSHHWIECLEFKPSGGPFFISGHGNAPVRHRRRAEGKAATQQPCRTAAAMSPPEKGSNAWNSSSPEHSLAAPRKRLKGCFIY